jgi:homoserine kinase
MVGGFKLLTMLSIKVPASSANLGPGFDCLALALKIHCLFEVQRKDEPGVTISLSGEGSQDLPSGKENLFFQVFQRVLSLRGLEPPGLRVRIKNSIPLGRGLGSSSTAVVAGVVAADRIGNLNLSKEEMFNLAVEIEGHPDNVAAALFGGLTISYREEGRGFRALAFPVDSGLQVILLVPPVSLSTQKAREVLPQKVDFADAVYNLSRTAALVSRLLTGQIEELKEVTRDKLHQHYRAPLYPQSMRLLERVRQEVDCGIAISGAGSSVVCLLGSSEVGLERKLKDLVREEFVEFEVISTGVDNGGVVVGSN